MNDLTLNADGINILNPYISEDESSLDQDQKEKDSTITDLNNSVDIYREVFNLEAIDNLQYDNSIQYNYFEDLGTNNILSYDENNGLYLDENSDNIYGGDGNDTLSGSDGNDCLIGGAGNDTYIVHHGGGSISEEENGGIDEIVADFNYNLGNKLIENLTLTGTEDLSGTGNWLDNSITGNNGNNILNGMAGNDILNGGIGSDIYIFDGNSGIDSINDTSGSVDKIVFNSDISKTNIAIFIDGSNSLVIDYGSAQGVNVVTVKNQDINTIEEIELSNGEHLSNNDINKLIQNISSYASENGLQLTNVPDIKSNQDLMNLIANSWHA